MAMVEVQGVRVHVAVMDVVAVVEVGVDVAVGGRGIEAVEGLGVVGMGEAPQGGRRRRAPAHPAGSRGPRSRGRVSTGYGIRAFRGRPLGLGLVHGGGVGDIGLAVVLLLLGIEVVVVSSEMVRKLVHVPLPFSLSLLRRCGGS